MSMITINDKKYDPADLTPDQQGLLAQVNNCREKARIAGMDLQIAQVAEQQFAQALIASVEAPTPEEKEPDAA